MTTVTDHDKDAMKNILNALNGDKSALKNTARLTNHTSSNYDEDLVGPGQVSPKAVNAMAQVLTKLNNVTSQVVTESRFDPQLSEAIHTHRTDSGVKVGNYQIMIKEDQKRIAGKQYYSIYNTKSNDIIANNLTLYEIALAVVKQLNDGKFANSSTIRKLFEIDDRYTSYRIDAIRFKYLSKTALQANDYDKSELYESRHQESFRRMNITKKEIKQLISESKMKKQ